MSSTQPRVSESEDNAFDFQRYMLYKALMEVIREKVGEFNDKLDMIIDFDDNDKMFLKVYFEDPDN
jgi:hypothetical protein